MAILPRPAGPLALLADLRAFVTAGDHRYKVIGAAFAIGITALWIFGFVVESRWGVLPEGPQITYVAEFAANRTDAEIIAQNKADQKDKDAALAERRRQFQKVDDAMSNMGF